jgi:hypothetical protein
MRAVTSFIDVSIAAQSLKSCGQRAKPKGIKASKGRSPMTMPSGSQKGSMFHSAVGQILLMGAAIVVILLIAWKYVF